MIGFKGIHFLKQYIANKKAHRWGIKAWVLAESNSGCTRSIHFYIPLINNLLTECLLFYLLYFKNEKLK
jgi:hypothetical protein